jgi:hypothetical protein
MLVRGSSMRSNNAVSVTEVDLVYDRNIHGLSKEDIVSNIF